MAENSPEELEDLVDENETTPDPEPENPEPEVPEAPEPEIPEITDPEPEIPEPEPEPEIPEPEPEPEIPEVPEPEPEPESEVPEIGDNDNSNNENEQTENRRNKKMKYGLKEVADVIFFDIATNRPVLVFDTLKVSNIENASESAEATGGKGNAPLVSWDYGRTATLTMQDALLSDQSLAMLAGTELVTGADVPNITRYEVVIAGDGGAITPTHDVAGEVTAYDNSSGVLGESLDVTGEVGDMVVTGAQAGDQIALFYESPAEEDSTLVTFQSDKFPSIYRVIGTSLVREPSGVDHPFQFRIPRAKLQSGFTFTMDPENVSTFDFNLQVLVDQGTKQLYDIIRY